MQSHYHPENFRFLSAINEIDVRVPTELTLSDTGPINLPGAFSFL